MAEPITGCSFTAQGFRPEEMGNLVEVLRALGIEVDCEIDSRGRTAKISVTGLPSVGEAKVRRTRNAGRMSIGTRPPASSIFNYETTCAEFLDWLEGRADGRKHTAREAMDELGLARSTYFRRLKSIRELVEWECVNNPRRLERGMAELHHKLRDVS